VKLGPLNYEVNGKILYHRIYGALFFVGALINLAPAVPAGGRFRLCFRGADSRYFGVFIPLVTAVGALRYYVFITLVVTGSEPTYHGQHQQ